MGMIYKQINDLEFSLKLLIDSIIEYAVNHKKMPDKIYLYPKEYGKFLYYIDVNSLKHKPSFIGIPIELYV